MCVFPLFFHSPSNRKDWKQCTIFWKQSNYIDVIDYEKEQLIALRIKDRRRYGQK